MSGVGGDRLGSPLKDYQRGLVSAHKCATIISPIQIAIVKTSCSEIYASSRHNYFSLCLYHQFAIAVSVTKSWSLLRLIAPFVI